MTSLIDLPELPKCLVAHFLSARDGLSLLSTHASMHLGLGRSRPFWEELQRVQFPSSSINRSTNPPSLHNWQTAKDSYLLQAHCNALETGVVRWYPVAPGEADPSDREGHMGCALGDYVVVAGGFAEDHDLYVKDMRVLQSSWQRVSMEGGSSGSVLPLWAYGSSLTALDATRAVRFGGFKGAGYSAETFQVAVLHLHDGPTKRSGAASHNNINNARASVQAGWEIMSCKFADGTVISDTDPHWSRLAARAYHTATMLFGRYLLILGGMQSSGSIMEPLLLDCETWTWYHEGITAAATETTAPTPRHGCSVVADWKRGRLVMFGGGDGSDLLRSGHDNTEVWALDLNGCASSATRDIIASLPWQWHCLHADQPNPEPGEEGEETDMDVTPNDGPNTLSPVEKLNLGRCHAGYRVGEDAVLLAMGSGRPSTNSLLGYNLARDEFVRPTVCGPFLPKARFTFASVYVESMGYLIVHGGFSTRNASEAQGDTVVLDLAPGMPRRPFCQWPVQTTAQPSPAVTNEIAVASRIPGGSTSILDDIISSLMATEASQRPEAAARMYAFLQATQRLGLRPALFLHMIATHRVLLLEDGSIREVEIDPHA